MRTRDEQVKKQIEDVNKTRNDFNAVNKKEGGNLTTRDFTDEIYEKGFDERQFIPETSEMFCNLLVVVPSAKLQEFKGNYHTIVDQYYAANDSVDEAKIPDKVNH